MNSLVPSDMDAESTASVDGFTYTVRVVNHGGGYQAHLTWRHQGGEQITPPFSNARAAMIEGHSMAEECIVAWRRPTVRAHGPSAASSGRAGRRTSRRP